MDMMSTTPHGMMNNMTTTAAPLKRRMWMWFHTKVNDTALFKFWWIHDTDTMIYSCAIVIVLAILLEFLKFGRWVVQLKMQPEGESLAWYKGMITAPHIVDSVLNAIVTIYSYMLMLVFMTFNVYLCFSLSFGLAVGHYLFGARRTQKNSY